MTDAFLRWWATEPLRFLLHPIALLAMAAAAQAWIDGATVRGIVVAVLGVLISAATEAARRRVTPLPDPNQPATLEGRTSYVRGP
jgi:hypothetical protein